MKTTTTNLFASAKKVETKTAMKVYHILFKENASDYISKGENFTDPNEIWAIQSFYQKYPDAIFIGLYDINALSSLHAVNRSSIQEQVDKEDQRNAALSSFQYKNKMEDTRK